MQPQSTACQLTIASVLALASTLTGAAGGHFDVDDATVLAPQRCQVEFWVLRGEAARLGHLGPACRVGTVELGLTLERLSEDTQLDTIVGGQAKWVAPLAPQIDIGLVAAASRDTTRGINLWTAYVPLTWSVGETVVLHANLGLDWLGQRGQSTRLGIAGEWTMDARVSLLAERFRLFDALATRGGMRVALGENANVDFSGARLSGSGRWIWGLGLAVEFGR